MKKIIISLSVIVAIAAVVAGATTAFFNDTETSAGNIFVAGSLDLKVDHVRQTYNGIDCKTCSIVLISDTSNMVIAKNGTPVPTPYPAAFLSWIHPAWTAQNDPELVAAGARWIWEQDPVKQEDTTQNVTYTFRKSFEWWGPIVNTDLYMAVGSDNSVEVWLNGTKIGENTGGYGYKQGSMLHIPAASITPWILQGPNVMEFKVTNWSLPGGNPTRNPAGLIYKFAIDGNCDNDYFKNNCHLWGLTDLTNQTFFDFDDVKPGDRGTNVISVHAYNNDAWLCLNLQNKDDDENVVVDPELALGDTASIGELSKYLNVFLWRDNDGDGVYEPTGEVGLGTYSFQNLNMVPLYDSTTPDGPMVASQTKYIGLAWCAGTISADVGTGVISCNASTMLNDAQTDKLTADLVLYAEQWRNNPNFSCEE